MNSTKRVLTTFLLAAASLPAAAIYTVGFEDIYGGGDNDFNDVEITTTGIDYEATGIYNFVPSPGYSEVPFLTGFYFDFGVVSDPGGIITFLSSQSAYANVAAMQIGVSNPWVAVPTSGTLAVSATVGTRVTFGLNTPYQFFYGSATQNADGAPHAVFIGGEEVPEPASLGFVGFILLAIAKLLKTRNAQKAAKCQF